MHSDLTSLSLLKSRFKKQYSDSTSIRLSDRMQHYQEFFSQEYESFKSGVAKYFLSHQNSFQVVNEHSDWMDTWIRFTWDFVRDEESMVMSELMKGLDNKKSYLKGALPQKKAKQKDLKAYLSAEQSQPIRMDPAEKAYYSNSLKDLEREIAEMQQELDSLNEIAPGKHTDKSDESRLFKSMVIFARGGYGRQELTYSSDVDLAYCLDMKVASALEVKIIQELFARMENLFQNISLDIASQYFELDEDISRFGRQEMLHTIPSILEGRALFGNTKILSSLKRNFLDVCPTEKMIRFLLNQMEELDKNDQIFLIKEGFGGIRHLQYVLWLVLIVENHEKSDSRYILDYLKRNDWITESDRAQLVGVLEFFFDLRNFVGLYSYFRKKIETLSLEQMAIPDRVETDVFNDDLALAFLKLKERFVTVDYLDRFRLHSIEQVWKLAKSIVKGMLNRTVLEYLPGFSLYKHLGSNLIVKIEPLGSKPKSSWNISAKAEERGKSEKQKQDDTVKELFENSDNLFSLFLFIARTGYRLSRNLKDGFSLLVDGYYKISNVAGDGAVKSFVHDLFVSENASIAIEQLLEISTPPSHDGHLKTLLGVFVPEVNQMRYLLRNIEVHEYPLCIHSLKALSQVEKEIEAVRKKEPELWRFVSEEDIFALKWATFFHDVGKINPYRDHEKLGPILAVDMLKRIGWHENAEVFDLIRLLVENHQSIVRYTQLSTYLDLGILQFFELAQRDPAKVVLLYLINLSDFKSVNKEMHKKSAHLENFFEKTLEILSEFKREELQGSLTQIVNNSLDRKVTEARKSVLIELLLRQCCNRSLEDIVLNPLQKGSTEEVRILEAQREDLESSIGYLKLAELDSKTLEKHRFRFIQIIGNTISDKNLFELVSPYSRTWNWFFTSIPNRYLLSSSVEDLTTQLQEFEGDIDKKFKLSYIKGERGGHDSLLFHFHGSIVEQAKIAYVLGWQGVNIENGKINKVKYQDGKEGFAGFFKVSAKQPGDRLSSLELQNIIENLVIPPLNPPKAVRTKKLSKVSVDEMIEKEKGYYIDERSKDQFKRKKSEYYMVKISLFDAPFVYYKILRSFEVVGIIPQQVTITTIGNQIIDYFYIRKKDKSKLEKNAFKSVLQKYINAEITIT